MNYHYQAGLFILFRARQEVPQRGTLSAEGTWFQEGHQVCAAEVLVERPFDLTDD